MFQFVHILMVPGLDPETYRASYKNEESFCWIIGVGDFESAASVAAEMAGKGYAVFNLCSAFNDETQADLEKAAGEGVKIRYAKKLPNEGGLAGPLTRYGFVAVAPGIEEPVPVQINDEHMEAEMWLVKDQEQANAAACKLAESGAQLIELCSWFTEERTQPIIELLSETTAVVRSCGLE